MTRKFLSIILVMAFMSYQSYHTLVYLNYYANYDYFVNVLCENKDNPEKPACNGKCHLKKQLDQQKPPQKEHPFSNTSSPVFYPDLFAVLLQKVKAKTQQESQNPYDCPSVFHINHPLLGQVFHPPKSFI